MDNKWLIIGGLGIAAVVLFIAMNKGSTANTNPGQTISPPGGVTSNTGTPANNNSLLGFVDPASGVQWIMDATDQWVATLPQGGLPPNYSPGAAFIFGSPIATTPTGQ